MPSISFETFRFASPVYLWMLLAPLALGTRPRPFAGGERPCLEGLLGEALDGGHAAFVRARHEHDRQATEARAPGAADAVNVILGRERHVVIDHDRQFDDVESPRRDVGCNQHFDGAALESIERLHALVLRLVAVDGVRVDSGLLQLAREAAAFDLRVDEDEHLGQAAAVRSARAKEFQQHVRLLGFVQLVDLLLHVVRRCIAASDFDQLRLAQEVRREPLDLLGERGREHQALPLLGKKIEDARDVGQEAHVEHPVGLVEHHDLHLRQVRVLLLDMIEQPARRGDDDFAAAPQGLRLRLHVDAAVDHRDAQLRLCRVLLEVVPDLVGKLARRRQHQPAHRVTRGRHAGVRMHHQPLQHRQAEPGRLAGSGLRSAHDVAAAALRVLAVDDNSSLLRFLVSAFTAKAPSVTTTTANDSTARSRPTYLCERHG